MNQVTVTAKTGPGLQDTALVLTNVDSINFDMVRRMVYITQNGIPTIKEYDLTGVTTVTCSISGSSYTWVIS